MLIPAFAVDRTEVLLHHLAELAKGGSLPAGVPIFVDSPMALSALRVYREALRRGDPDTGPSRLAAATRSRYQGYTRSPTSRAPRR